MRQHGVLYTNENKEKKIHLEHIHKAQARRRKRWIKLGCGAE